EDRDGDGRADHQNVFAGPFNGPLDGTAAGLLMHHGDLWFTCIPHLWKLRDADGDGQAEVQEKVFTGFGVRDAFRGHDEHGLILGPDGWLYFNMADRGYNIALPDGSRLFDPMDVGRGAVYRCRLDGSDLHVFYCGLRNAQEMAFDEFGQLFTVDNNSDAGDEARLVHVLEGGDSGWSMVFQYGTPAHTVTPTNRGLWHGEKLWHLQHEGQPAWILPPLAHFTNGPSGMVHEPGVTALGPKWRGSFFVVDFKGDPANTGIWNFKVRPRGAGFELDGLEKFVWNVAATDCDFGPDGRFYLTDFMTGWVGTGEGRIWALSHPAAVQDPAVEEVRTLLAEDLENWPTDRLAPLLSHADARIRLRAQYALAGGDADAALKIFTAQSQPGATTVPRLHGIWGLSMLRGGVGIPALIARVNDSDPQVRQQAARMLGDLHAETAAGALLSQWQTDGQPSVISQLAIALGKLHAEAAAPLVLTRLADNADQDVFLRHSLALGLSGMQGADALAALASHDSRSVRLGAVLALRQQRSPSLAAFLDDADDGVAAEAIRAIYDLPGIDAMSQVGALLEDHPRVLHFPEFTALRVLHAAARSGQAALVASWAVEPQASVPSRLEALHLLATWAQPDAFDRVTGYHRPQAERPAQPAQAALTAVLDSLFEADPQIVQHSLAAAASLQVPVAEPVLLSMARDTQLTPELRADLLDRLHAQASPQLTPLIQELLTLPTTRGPLRITAARLLALTDPTRGLDQLLHIITSDQVALRQRQAAVAALATVKAPAAAQHLARLVAAINAGQLDPGLALDVLEAARQTAAQPAAQELATWDAAHPATDLLAPLQPCLQGGDAQRGRQVFADNLAAQCMRCHKVQGGGGMAGPELSQVGVSERASPSYFLESLVNPSAFIVPGYGTAAVTLKDGSSISGVLKAETQDHLTLQDAAGSDRVIPTADIAERSPTISSMPPMGLILTQREIRDVIAYLLSLGKDGKAFIE
ncbi:MAG: HEAT repeat domain-containing protein, partial [Verrucomicrobiales bacterium]|nr:HEAT repeat domain-containing protein [Verrucomicrobiales bacterium]